MTKRESTESRAEDGPCSYPRCAWGQFALSKKARSGWLGTARRPRRDISTSESTRFRAWRCLPFAFGAAVSLVFLLCVGCASDGPTSRFVDGDARPGTETEARPTWAEWVALKMQVYGGVLRGARKFSYSIEVQPSAVLNEIWITISYHSVPRDPRERDAMRAAINDDAQNLNILLLRESIQESNRVSTHTEPDWHVRWKWRIVGTGLEDVSFPPSWMIETLQSTNVTESASGQGRTPNR